MEDSCAHIEDTTTGTHKDTNFSSSCRVSSPTLHDDPTPDLLKDTPLEEPKPFSDPEIPQYSEEVAQEEVERPLPIERPLPTCEGDALENPKSDNGLSRTGLGEFESLETLKYAEEVGIQESGVEKLSLKDPGEAVQAPNADGTATSVDLNKVGSHKTLQQTEELSDEKMVLGTLADGLTEVAQAPTADSVPVLTDLDKLDLNTSTLSSVKKTELFQDLEEPEGSQPALPLPTQGTSPSRSSTCEDFKDIPSTSETFDDRPQIQSSSNASKLPAPTLSEPTSIAKPSDSPEEVFKSATSKPPAKDGSVHQVKWISFNGSKVPIITQNENGPCPMIAITNVLLLRGKLTLPADHEVVSSDLIIAALSDELLSYSTVDWDEGMRLNYEENLSSALSIFPSLQTGLDINVRFTGVSDFEYTPALTIFDLFRIPLYHGWVADPQDRDLVEALKNQTYNQVVEMIIDYKSSSDPACVEKGLLAEEFLETAASQLTMCGLCELSEHLQENQLAVLFRNNHFNTIYKKAGHIYVLVTDVGFVSEPNFVWETLNNIDGDSQFVDGEFHVCTKPTSNAVAVAAAPNATAVAPTSAIGPAASSAPSATTSAVISTPSEQNDLNHKLAVERADLELAKRLQAEEDVAYLKQSSDSASQSPSCSPSHHRQNGSGYDPAKSSSWQEAAQARSDLELARRLQAAENAAYYSQAPGSPHHRPHHSPSHSSQHRHRHQQEQASSSWKCTIS
ncbi:Ubiquitin carboxyl-terminal hydrolase MINDY-1 [Taenia crassiceps]|uniref:Ubiquitin carboxyl-terminal hydrolase n=1 Tax=Taenia crassiceps TaxID=6207 RepID=A0ABR4QQA9_9CEST